MKFQTTIKIISDAKDKHEAMEIAGEYLSGNLTSGVHMKLCTVSICDRARRIGITLAVALVFGLLTLHISHVKCANRSIQNIPGDSAIQPPLNTSLTASNYSDFKNEWLVRHSKEVLNSLKK